MTTQTDTPPRDGNAIRQDTRHIEKVRGIFTSLAKFVSAQAIYQSNNPNLANFARAFEQAFRSYFQNENELLLTVSQYQLIWREQVVYDVGCNTESIAFLLYKDGVGEISIHSTVATTELEQFVGILKNALYCPSAQFDIATALWNAEFPNIFYRVLDEQSDGGDGKGDGAGGTQREQPLRANDHQDLLANETPTVSRKSDSDLETLGSYVRGVVNSRFPGADPARTEQHMQAVLSEHFSIDSELLAEWTAAMRPNPDADSLVDFLRIMLDFTRVPSTPPVIRDVNDTIERLVHYIRDEAHVTTLIATLELQASLDPETLESGFASLPDRIEAELAKDAFLLALARDNRDYNAPQDVLRYLKLVGGKSTAAVCELLARSTDPSIHEKGCEVLIDIAGADILRIIEELDIENPYLVNDIVYLLSRSSLRTIPPVITRILSSSDPKIRRCAIGFLACAETDESTQMLVRLLKDEDQGVRVKTLVAVEGVPHPLIVDEVTKLCFDEKSLLKSSDELEIMFRALGKLAGAHALPRLQQTVEKRHYLPIGKSRSKRDKLLAITALRYIPGAEARRMLEKLSEDGDTLVRTKALHMLKQIAAGSADDPGPLSKGLEGKS